MDDQYEGVSNSACACPSASEGHELNGSRRRTVASLSIAIAKLTRQVVQLTRRIDYLERKAAARDLLDNVRET